ncbi:hypothetical protein DY000_02004618 [Brassica cretica]|uniref:CNNM transmembrane domain-containing protein n=1 Tax=Brassica cretica TaxID=69181 RepID=A0ABQ7CJK4_BRACR|nr:hypothetical protein DY000_02004618 [Brassica cretica]
MVRSNLLKKLQWQLILISIGFGFGVGFSMVLVSDGNSPSKSKRSMKGNSGWRISLGLDCVSAVIIMMIGALNLPDTLNSLIKRGFPEESKQMIRSIQGTDEVEEEFQDLIDATAYRNQCHYTLRARSVLNLGFGSKASLISAMVTGIIEILCTFVSVFTVDSSSSSRSQLAPARSRQTIKAFPIRRSQPDRRDPVPDCSSSFATSASIRSRPDRKQLDPIGVSSRPVRVQLAVHPSWWSGFNKHLG